MAFLLNNVTLFSTVLFAYYNLISVSECPNDIFSDYQMILAGEYRHSGSGLCASYSFGLIGIWSPPVYYDNVKDLILQAKMTPEKNKTYVSLYFELKKGAS